MTFGKEEGGFAFDEGISTEGVLRWQSRPQQRLTNKTIVRLIGHDEAANSIYLFLRTADRRAGRLLDYTYLGKLKYLTHDNEREQPVHFDWQLLRWPIPSDVLNRMGLNLEGSEGFGDATAAPTPDFGAVVMALEETTAPDQGARSGTSTRQFRGRIKGDHAVREKANQVLGTEGEKLVVEHERKTLSEAGREDLAAKVRHIALEEGDGAGYDVLSFFADGRPRYIEVKTTRGPVTSDFFITPNEVAFAQAHADCFELRRLYDFDNKAGTCRFYSIFGNIEA
ncbi:MAG TPA: DUF3427 domain-containing protein, partial [Afifellaceae bacterium]|nr:DUF3427 domain-containing protein [Afifellaceae bacterium]